MLFWVLYYFRFATRAPLHFFGFFSLLLKIMIALIILASDTSEKDTPNALSDSSILGRFHRDLMPAQSLMEIAIEETTDQFKDHFKREDGSYKDISEWPGVRFSEGNSKISIIWFEDYAFPSHIKLSCLPSEVKIFCAASNGFQGAEDLGNLPRKLESLNIERNDFHGSVDLTQLPQKLKDLDASFNRYEGSVCLTSLPDSLQSLYLGHNFFTGSLDFSNLSCLQFLSIEANEFSGSIDTSNLTDTLQNLCVSENSLCGELCLENLPDSIEELRLNKNNF